MLRLNEGYLGPSRPPSLQHAAEIWDLKSLVIMVVLRLVIKSLVLDLIFP